MTEKPSPTRHLRCNHARRIIGPMVLACAGFALPVVLARLSGSEVIWPTALGGALFIALLLARGAGTTMPDDIVVAALAFCVGGSLAALPPMEALVVFAVLADLAAQLLTHPSTEDNRRPDSPHHSEPTAPQH